MHESSQALSQPEFRALTKQGFASKNFLVGCSITNPKCWGGYLAATLEQVKKKHPKTITLGLIGTLHSYTKFALALKDNVTMTMPEALALSYQDTLQKILDNAEILGSLFNKAVDQKAWLTAVNKVRERVEGACLHGSAAHDVLTELVNKFNTYDTKVAIRIFTGPNEIIKINHLLHNERFIEQLIDIVQKGSGVKMDAKAIEDALPFKDCADIKNISPSDRAGIEKIHLTPMECSLFTDNERLRKSYYESAKTFVARNRLNGEVALITAISFFWAELKLFGLYSDEEKWHEFFYPGAKIDAQQAAEDYEIIKRGLLNYNHLDYTLKSSPAKKKAARVQTNSDIAKCNTGSTLAQRTKLCSVRSNDPRQEKWITSVGNNMVGMFSTKAAPNSRTLEDDCKTLQTILEHVRFLQSQSQAGLTATQDVIKLTDIMNISTQIVSNVSKVITAHTLHEDNDFKNSTVKSNS